MKNELTKNKASLLRKINLFSEWSINYWTVTLGCNVQDLGKAIAKVGTCPQAISAFLDKTLDRDNSRNTFHTSVRELKTGRIIDLRVFHD